MINIRHTGIYVDNIDNMELFYTNVFGMHLICSKEEASNKLINELLHQDNAKIMTTKLITDYGKKQKTGDMLELVKVLSFSTVEKNNRQNIYLPGTAHIAIGVDDISNISDKIKDYGGEIETSIVMMESGRKCCFAKDPEGNWIELIE